jgi:hypothetical protein
MMPFTRVLMIVPLLCVTGYSDDAVEAVKPDAICGTWVRTQKLADGSQISVMKIITPTHFAVFQQDAAKVNRDVFQAHSGRFSLQDGLMTETYEFSSNPNAIGKTSKCRLAVDGDKLRQTWTRNEGPTIVEEWDRLRPQNKEKVTEEPCREPK